MVQTVWQKRHLYNLAQVDVYSGRAFIWAEAVCYLLTWLKKPIVLTLHGGNLPTFSQKWPQRVQRLLRTAAHVTTPSAYLYTEMRPFREDLEILPNSLPIARYTYRLRQQCQPHLIWLRAFHQIYNPVLAIHVIERLKKQYPDIHLYMIGPDKGDGSQQEAEALCTKLGLNHHISFIGPVAKETVPQWLNKGDIFINTTNIDNTPVSVLEALATGLCVVSTNAGGIPYLLTDQENSLLVEPDNVERTVEAVDKILKDEQLASTLSRNGRQHALKFDESDVMTRWQTLLTGYLP